MNTRISPLENSPWNVEAKYSYRHRSDKDASSGDRRQRFDVGTGYAWRTDDFAFTPKVLVRREEFEASNSYTQYRFYPGMSYKISDNWSTFLGGFSGFGAQNGTSDDKDRYLHEYEVGFRHSF